MTIANRQYLIQFIWHYQRYGLIVVAVMIVIGSVMLFIQDSPHEFKISEQISGKAWLLMEGEIDHAMTADLTTPAQATLQSINVAEDSFVMQGAPLFSLSSPDLLQKYTTALNRKADLEFALKRKSDGADSLEISRKLVEVNSADVAFHSATTDYDATRELESLGLATLRELRDAQQRKETAASQRKIAHQELALTRATYINTLQNQQRELDALKQILSETEQDIAQLAPTARFDGYARIGRISKDCTGCVFTTGSKPSAGQTVMKLYSAKRIARTPKGIDNDLIQEGAPVRIEFDTVSGHKSVSSVIRVALQGTLVETSSDSRARSLYAEIPNDAAKDLRLGEKHRAQLSIQVQASGFKIPAEFVTNEHRDMYVHLVENGKITKKSIFGYVLDDGTIIVEHGVTANDTLVAK